MSDRTGIEWTDKTWNPWMGCTKVSPGCAHCYMFTEQTRYKQDPSTVRRSKTTFDAPLKWKEPARVFTCSWSDWFHEDADAWRDEAWAIVRATPHLTYQILTKRAERIAAHLPADWDDGYPNVWLGVSVENQRHAYRASLLAEVPARVRFLSCEPLLGPVSFEDVWVRADAKRPILEAHVMGLIDWVIVGGESGPGARPMDADWARQLRDECDVMRVAFFLKQLGGFPDKRGGDKAVLDGEAHHEMPDAVSA